jgi:hypothetical protein
MSDVAAHKIDYFLYTGQCGGDILRDVTHVRVHPSVRAIKNWAFNECRQLSPVILGNGLEEIGERAFYECTSLVRIAIPPAVQVIKDCAFSGCSGLTAADLNDGLEEIGEGAFQECTSLIRIAIPPAVRAIKACAFVVAQG